MRKQLTFSEFLWLGFKGFLKVYFKSLSGKTFLTIIVLFAVSLALIDHHHEDLGWSLFVVTILLLVLHQLWFEIIKGGRQ